MKVVFCSHVDDPEIWGRLIGKYLPELELVRYQDCGACDDADFLLINPDHAHVLPQFPRVKGVLSLFAGVEKIAAAMPPELADVPLIRLVSPDLSAGMAQYVVYHCLRYHRRFAQAEAARADRVWDIVRPEPRFRNVGIMGLGALGEETALALAGLGFTVRGWSRSRKPGRAYESFAGEAELGAFLGQSHILVGMLPLTPATEGILCAETFARMPQGAALINIGRGGHLVEADLLAALDSGQLGGATLDVFATEPLPADHPFWSRPEVGITAHIAAFSEPCDASARWFADNMRRLHAGEPPLGGVVDRALGY